MNGLVYCVLLLLAVTGCATRESADPAAEGADEKLAGAPACFYRRQVSDFRPLDRSNLVVYAPTRSNAYHVQISPPSTSLRWADAIAFKSRSSRICGYAGERVLLDGSATAREFSVVSVHRLDETAYDSLLARYGIGEAAVELEPAETTGAEIEREFDADDQPEE